MKLDRFRLATAGPVVVVLVQIIALVIFGIAMFRLMESNTQQAIRAVSNPITSTSSKLLFNPLYLLDVAEARNILTQYVDGQTIVFGAVYNDTGQRVTTVSPSWIPDEATSNALVLRSIAENIQIEEQVDPYLILTTPIRAGSEVIGAVEYVIDQNAMRSSLGSYQFQILLIISAVLVATAVLFFFLIRAALTPLEKLTGIAHQIGEGDLDVTIPLNGAEEIASLAHSMESMRSQIKETLQRAAERSKALVASSEISRRLSTYLSEKQLVAEVVDELQNAFDYYHTHIYFYDEDGSHLVMAGGSGEAGAAMLARGHKISKGRGLVGSAAETNAPVLVSDTSKDINWLPNPLLPDTKSEVAVPISIGNDVLGVLDVQQNIVAGLKEDDVVLLQSIANQVAIAVRNARSYEESKSKADLETMINTIGQKIQRAGTVEDVLQTAIREVGMALGASRVSATLQPARTAMEPHTIAGGNGADPKR